LGICSHSGLRAQITLGHDQLPEGIAHVALGRLYMIAALKSAVDLLDRDSSDLAQCLLGELKRPSHDRGDVPIAPLVGSHPSSFVANATSL
jgi:hypothetical protein